MTVVAFAAARDAPQETTSTCRRWNGNHYPYAATGVIVGEGTVLCVDCADDRGVEQAAAFTTSDEHDYPGTHCADCGGVLPGTLLIYDSGPGSELLQREVPDRVELRDDSLLDD